jgi:hypothetical protein
MGLWDYPSLQLRYRHPHPPAHGSRLAGRGSGYSPWTNSQLCRPTGGGRAKDKRRKHSLRSSAGSYRVASQNTQRNRETEGVVEEPSSGTMALSCVRLPSSSSSCCCSSAAPAIVSSNLGFSSEISRARSCNSRAIRGGWAVNNGVPVLTSKFFGAAVPLARVPKTRPHASSSKRSAQASPRAALVVWNSTSSFL